MNSKNNLRTFLQIVGLEFKLNMKIIFANAFKWWLIFTFALFALTVTLSFIFDWNFDIGRVYIIQVIVGMILIFYPTVFGIQNDEDAKILEILFSIPNYRYKVWVVRMTMMYIIIGFFLFIFSCLNYISFTTFSVIEMTLQSMLPMIFLGSLAFCISTIVKNGMGTAVVYIIVLLIFIIIGGDSAYNLFLNPFAVPLDMNEIIWDTMILKNRVYISVVVVIANLIGLTMLQKRERFI